MGKRRVLTVCACVGLCRRHGEQRRQAAPPRRPTSSTRRQSRYANSAQNRRCDSEANSRPSRPSTLDPMESPREEVKNTRKSIRNTAEHEKTANIQLRRCLRSQLPCCMVCGTEKSDRTNHENTMRSLRIPVQKKKSPFCTCSQTSNGCLSTFCDTRGSKVLEIMQDLQELETSCVLSSKRTNHGEFDDKCKDKRHKQTSKVAQCCAAPSRPQSAVSATTASFSTAAHQAPP